MLLEKYRQNAIDAFHWTSFEPEKRGAHTIKEYSEELQADLTCIPAAERAQYQSKYEALFLAWLSAQARCSNCFITGRGNYNVRRAAKYDGWAQRHYETWRNWRDKALNAIAKTVENNRPQEEKDAETLERLQKDVDFIVNAKQGGPYSPAPFVSNFCGRLNTLAKHGRVEVVEQIINYALAQKAITPRNKACQLAEIARANRDKSPQASAGQCDTGHQPRA